MNNTAPAPRGASTVSDEHGFGFVSSRRPPELKTQDLHAAVKLALPIALWALALALLASLGGCGLTGSWGPSASVDGSGLPEVIRAARGDERAQAPQRYAFDLPAGTRVVGDIHFESAEPPVGSTQETTLKGGRGADPLYDPQFHSTTGQ